MTYLTEHHLTVESVGLRVSHTLALSLNSDSEIMMTLSLSIYICKIGKMAYNLLDFYKNQVNLYICRA